MLFFGGNFGRDKRLLAHFTGRVLLRPDHTFFAYNVLGLGATSNKNKKVILS